MIGTAFLRYHGWSDGEIEKGVGLVRGARHDDRTGAATEEELELLTMCLMIHLLQGAGYEARLRWVPA